MEASGVAGGGGMMVCGSLGCCMTGGRAGVGGTGGKGAGEMSGVCVLMVQSGIVSMRWEKRGLSNTTSF